MKYETPIVTALSPAIHAIQGNIDVNKSAQSNGDSSSKEGHAAYADWED